MSSSATGNLYSHHLGRSIFVIGIFIVQVDHIFTSVLYWSFVRSISVFEINIFPFALCRFKSSSSTGYLGTCTSSTRKITGSVRGTAVMRHNYFGEFREYYVPSRYVWTAKTGIFPLSNTFFMNTLSIRLQ